MKVSELIKLGFSFGTFAGHVTISDGNYWKPSASLGYRPGINKTINTDSDIDWNRFYVSCYGSSSCIDVPIIVKSIEDIQKFISFFNPINE